MPSVVGLLEQWAHHSPSCRDLREEADRLQAELAVAEREWKTVAPEWRAGLASSALSVDYQRILQALSAHICCGDHHREQQAKGVDDVPLAAVDQLAVVEAAAVRADDRVRLTDCESITPAPGSESRPARSRTRRRSRSWNSRTRSWLRQRRKDA